MTTYTGKNKGQEAQLLEKQNAEAQGQTFCGPHMKLPSLPAKSENVPLADRLLHIALGQAFRLSPAAMLMAYTDWLTHLAMAPGKQAELTHSVWDKAVQLAMFIRCDMLGHDHEECCAHPLPQDKRFTHPEWEEWPYSLYQQIFLHMEEWWRRATDVRGISQHHAAVLPFMARQFLDMVSPLNFPVTNPRVANATLKQGGFNFFQGAQNFWDDWSREISGQPAIGLENYHVGENIAVTKGKVVYRNRLIELIQYASETGEVHSDPVLIVPAWIMKYYILDLSPENSLVKYLVDQGHTVFIISWKNPGPEDRNLGFEDYLNLGIMDALKAVNTIVPEQKVHLTGYCLGGTLAVIAAATLARDGEDRLKSLTLFAAQVDFEEAGELLMFIDESQLSWLEDIMWEKGYLDGRHMAGTFQMLRSHDLIWSRAVEHYMLGERILPNDLMAWNADITRLPYKMHSEYLRRLFLNNDLSEGRFTVNDKPVALSDIRAPLFVVSTQRDHVSPWRSVYKMHLLADTDITFILASGGHNAGIISEPGHAGRRYQIATQKEMDKYIPPEEWAARQPYHEGSWWTAWQHWLVKQSSGMTTPPQTGAPEKGYAILAQAPGDYVLVK